ncbi:unnamed protein product [Effrenium voratum]|uniref:Uncharacterized protein n=1 Tax=Effrenium voratum TaxID=2562239 RepID=A0AA36HVF4_9DINO|nr:unnamed protein product [Effrenium voratum]CAJ1417067.1 unnamed protein product [Effrenium voratum]
MEELRCEHALKVAEVEQAKTAQIDEMKRSSMEEIEQLRSALAAARWQADVYVREHQDAVREICLRQRENARLGKRHAEARQEALELAVRLEQLRAVEAGAPAREAELQAVRQRYILLQQTAAEWREALLRKSGDCEVWRRRAELKGVPMHREDMELQAEIQSVTSSSPSYGHAFRSGMKMEAVGRASYLPSPVQSRSPVLSRSGRHPWPELSSIRTPLQSPHRHSNPTRGRALDRAGWQPSLASQRSPSPHPAGEFVNVVLKAAKLRAEANLKAGVMAKHRERALLEAENEVEMLAFLLEEGDSSEAEVLLEMEAQAQESASPAIAAHLRAQITELQGRRQRSVSPPELTA